MFFEKFLERVASVLGRDVLISIISFLLTTYLANKLGAQRFGLWIGIMTLLTVLDLLFRLKIDQLIVFYSKQYPYNSALYIRVSLLSLYGVLVGGAVVSILHAPIVDFFALSGVWLLGAIFANFSLSVFGNICFYIFLAEGRYSAYNLVLICQSITTAFAVFVGFYLFESSLVFALFAHILSWIVVLSFFFANRLFIKFKDPVAYGTSSDLSDGDILQKGRYTFASSALAAGAGQLPRLFVLNFLGPAYLGYLGLAQTIVGLINRIPLSVNTVLYPMLVNQDSGELSRTISIVRVLILIFLPVFLFLVMLTPFLVETFYGVEYARVSLYLQILLPFAYLGLPGVVLGSYYSSQGEFNVLFITNLAAAVVSFLSLCVASLISNEFAPIVALCAAFTTITIVSLAYMPKSVRIAEILPKFDDIQLLAKAFRAYRDRSRS